MRSTFIDTTRALAHLSGPRGPITKKRNWIRSIHNEGYSAIEFRISRFVIYSARSATRECHTHKLSGRDDQIIRKEKEEKAEPRN